MSIAVRPAQIVPIPIDLPTPVQPQQRGPGTTERRQPVPSPDTASRVGLLQTLRPGADRPRSEAETLLRDIQTARSVSDLTDIREHIERLPDGPTRTHLLAECSRRRSALHSDKTGAARKSFRQARAAVAGLKTLDRSHVSTAKKYAEVGRLLASLPTNAQTAALKREFLDAGAAFFRAHADDDKITLTRTLVLRPIRTSMVKVLRSDPRGIMKAYTGDLDPEAGDGQYTEVTKPLAQVMQALLDDHGTVGPFGSEQDAIDKDLAATMAELVKAGDPRFMTLVSASAQGYVGIRGELAKADQKARDRLSTTLGLAMHALGGSVGVHGWKAITASGIGHEIMHEIIPEGPDRFGQASDDIATLMGRAHRLLDLFRSPDRELDRAVNDRVSAVRDGAPNAVGDAELLAGVLRGRLQEVDTIVAAGVADPHLQRALKEERENIMVALDSLFAVTDRSKQSSGTAERATALVDELASIDDMAGANTEDLAALRVRRLEAQLELRRLLPRLERRGASPTVDRARTELARLDRGDNAIVARLDFLQEAIFDSEAGKRRDALISEARGLLDLLDFQIADLENLVAGERARHTGDTFAGDDAFLSLGQLQGLHAEAARLRHYADNFMRVARAPMKLG